MTAPVTLELEGASAELADDLVAVHGAEGASVRPAGSRAPAGATLGPVYRRPSGDVLVPTGRALVRFAEGDRAEAHRADLTAAGYELERPLGYAPHAGWVRAAGIAEALAGLDRLRAIEGVEHVEPEILMERSARS